MKRYLIIFIIPVLIILSGCEDFIDRKPLTNISPGVFWDTEADLQLALNILYTNIYQEYEYNLDNYSIDSYGESPNLISSGTYSPPNTDATYSRSYRMIRIANHFLENYESSKISESLKNQYAGEAYFFRAWYYFELIKRFGDVIYFNKTLDMNSEELYGTRTDKEVVLKGIIKDLEFAVSHIPEASKMTNLQGRVTKGTANSLMARICLYYGTWYKYHDSGSNKHLEYLEKAKKASGEVISSAEYSLHDDYYNLFLMTNAYESNETILAYRFSSISGLNLRIRATIVDFGMRPTKHLADAFLFKDGLPIGKSSYNIEYLPIAEGTEFNNRDPRMAQTIWRPGDGNDWAGVPFLPSYAVNTKTGYLFKKYGDMGAYQTMSQYVDVHLIRYAEILLTYAEATYELNNSISNEDLNKSINELRKRFSTNPNALPNLTNEFVTSNGLDMREEIRRERRVELAGEFFRYDDLIRWKTAEVELSQDILGAKFDKNAYPTINIESGDLKLNNNGFVLLQQKKDRQFNPAKDYLFPLPLREISLNDNLKQNPNW